MMFRTVLVVLAAASATTCRAQRPSIFGFGRNTEATPPSTPAATPTPIIIRRSKPRKKPSTDQPQTDTQKAAAANSPDATTTPARSSKKGANTDGSASNGIATAPQPAAGVLPQTAIERAKQAEKLAGTDPKQGIAAYEKIDKEFPGRAPLSLRLAQLYDQVNDNGTALFYYRRYHELSSGHLREEAQFRLAALEALPGAADAAEQVAKKRNEKTAPVAVPTSAPKWSILVEQGNKLRPLKSEDDVTKLERGEQLPAEPTPLNEVLDVEKMKAVAAARQRAASGSAASIAPAAGTRTPAATASSSAPAARATIAVKGTDEDAELSKAFVQRPTDASSAGSPLIPPRTVIQLPERKPTPAASNPNGATAPGGMSMPGETPLITSIPPVGSNTASRAASNISGPSLLNPSATPARGMGDVPSLSGNSLPANDPVAAALSMPPVVDGTQQINISSSGNPGGASLAGTTPAAAQPRRVVTGNRQAALTLSQTNFFNLKNVGGPTAMVRIANGVPNSTLTFIASPKEGGESYNALLTSGEHRDIKLPPGEYMLSVTVATGDYPPSTALDRKFPYQFRAGTQYIRNVTPEAIQGIE